MIFKYKLILIITILCFSSIKANTIKADSSFIKANSLYENENYSSAKDIYKRLLDDDYISVELYLNIGNSYYKLDSIASAILYYEKGLKISPGNENLIHNLKLCNNLIADKSGVKESILINEWIYSFLNHDTNYWAYLSIILIFITVVLIVLFYLFKLILFKKTCLYIAIITMIFSLTSIYFSYLSKSILEDSNYGILFSTSVQLKTKPSEIAETAFVLHEGSKVKIRNSSKLWYEIYFDKKVAWVKKTDLKLI